VSASTNRHQEIVKKLLDSKAVDFAAIGKAVAELGPSLAVSEEPWEGFCGTMRIFIHLYRIYTPGTPVEQLGELSGVAQQIR
jgi:hypothetical protein